MYSLNFLNFVYIGVFDVETTLVFDVETTLENTKLAILERLELDIFFIPSHPWWEAD